ncbi:MAG: hypothetical protein EBU88_17205, partial [Acidobacteria bacterium]|nr:hypothetical protein [Acidobacteriota bacterium]
MESVAMNTTRVKLIITLSGWLIIGLVVQIGLVGSVRGQTSRSLDKETFFEMESVSNPQISPDGRSIV